MSKTLRILTVAIVLIVAVWPLLAAEEGPGNAARGRAAFNLYCSSCHGKTAKGDGPVAATLKVAPTDLTQLALSNGGKFPVEQTHAYIDGRRAVAAHGPSDMPVWGLSFQDPGKDTDQEAMVRARIKDIVAFIESLQEKG
ncbi:MAG TPA: cytochrome c [Thermoanaerobaculia bacterium]|nr:cytochrome c [Thermoanaerobaculia bacterium]